MIGYIWLFLIVSSIVVSIFTGRIAEVSNAILLSAKTAVNIAISLIGIMAFWLGIVKLAERSGMVALIAKAIKPITRFLFPSVPSEHPSLGNVALNFSANALGVTNAATPIGIKAMEEFQELNPKKDTATNPMCMFLAMNTAGFQLIPASAIAVLVAVGCDNPTVVILPALFATTIAFVSAILIAKLFEKIYNEPVGDEVEEVNDGRI